MYKDDIKIFVENEKEMENLKQIIRILSLDRGMDFNNEKCVMLIMKNKKTAKPRKNFSERWNCYF